jgi:hypothetical protein
MNRAAIVLPGVALALVAAGCSPHSPTAPEKRTSSSTAGRPPTMTLIVKSSVGPRRTPSVLSAVGGDHACQGWNVSANSYGRSVSVQHVIVTRAEGRRTLARVRDLPSVLSVSLAGPDRYDQVPAPEPGFGVGRSFPCLVD